MFSRKDREGSLASFEARKGAGKEAFGRGRYKSESIQNNKRKRVMGKPGVPTLFIRLIFCFVPNISLLSDTTHISTLPFSFFIFMCRSFFHCSSNLLSFHRSLLSLLSLIKMRLWSCTLVQSLNNCSASNLNLKRTHTPKPGLCVLPALNITKRSI